MSEAINTRKLRVKMPQALSINSATVADVVADSLKRTWGHLRHAPKLLARQIEANERTAENLLTGKNAPSSATLVKLMAEDDEVFAAILDLAGRNPPPAQEQIKAIEAALAILKGKRP
jgi:hypothetical protein